MEPNQLINNLHAEDVRIGDLIAVVFDGPLLAHPADEDGEGGELAEVVDIEVLHLRAEGQLVDEYEITVLVADNRVITLTVSEIAVFYAVRPPLAEPVTYEIQLEEEVDGGYRAYAGWPHKSPQRPDKLAARIALTHHLMSGTERVAVYQQTPDLRPGQLLATARWVGGIIAEMFETEARS